MIHKDAHNNQYEVLPMGMELGERAVPLDRLTVSKNYAVPLCPRKPGSSRCFHHIVNDQCPALGMNTSVEETYCRARKRTRWNGET